MKASHWTPQILRYALICTLVFGVSGITGCAQAEMGEVEDELGDKASSGLQSETSTIDQSKQPRVIGGQNEDGQSATIRIEKVLADGRQGICSGVLISPTAVLTAAHCVAELTVDDLTIRNGTARFAVVFSGDQEVQRVAVVDSVFHRDWNDSNLQQGVDLGIAYLAEPVNVQPVNLDGTAPDSRLGAQGLIVGYGVTEDGSGGRKKSTTMVVDKYLRNQFLLKSSDQSLRASCNGDSGGPFFIGEGPLQVLAGIASWGPPACDVDDSYYVSVQAHMAWIRENLQGATTGVRQKVKYFGNLTCGQSVECQKKCEGDAFCRDDCFEETTLAAQQLYFEVASCRRQQQCEDDACVEQKCPQLYQRCMGGIAEPQEDGQNPLDDGQPDGGQNNMNPEGNKPAQPDPAQNPNPQPAPNPPLANGGGPCSDLIQCTTNCRDFACIDQCVDKGTAPVENLIASIWQCYEQQCNPFDFQCFSDRCLPLIEQCF